MTEKKYFKPRSLTWWASLAPLFAGLFIAAEPLHNLTEWAKFVQTAFGGASPAVLVNAGLAGIGIRGAMG